MQSLMQEFPQRVFGIFEEQTVVAKRRHGNGDLSKVVEILQHRTLQKNHQTQETRASEGREGWEKHSPGETRGPGSVCGSPQSPRAPQRQDPQAHPPHLPHYCIRAHPSLGLLSCPLSAPSWLQTGGTAQGRKGRAPTRPRADPNLRPQLPSPRS